MDKGAESYRGFLGSDDRGLAEQVEAYKDGLILYLNGYVNNILPPRSWRRTHFSA